jgi:3',5'-nucleoside bisphosphate phosphatase
VIDLHTHTVHSDGTTTPAVNAAMAASAGLRGLALTDHDTIAGWDEMADACRRRGLLFVPGIELSTERGEASVHLLGYWPDPEHPELNRECDRLRHERDRRARQILARLDTLGVTITWEQVAAVARSAPVGRPHVAAAMVEAGAVADVASAFELYLGDGGPAWVPKYALDPVAGLRLIRAAGGVGVLAHPGTGDVSDELAEELADAGLAGVESFHPGHDGETAARWAGWARERELVATGSSDFHGDAKSVRIGERGTDVPALETLREMTAKEEALRW